MNFGFPSSFKFNESHNTKQSSLSYVNLFSGHSSKETFYLLTDKNNKPFLLKTIQRKKTIKNMFWEAGGKGGEEESCHYVFISVFDTVLIICHRLSSRKVLKRSAPTHGPIYTNIGRQSVKLAAAPRSTALTYFFRFCVFHFRYATLSLAHAYTSPTMSHKLSHIFLIGSKQNVTHPFLKGH